jgi:hypothetical protein
MWATSTQLDCFFVNFILMSFTCFPIVFLSYWFAGILYVFLIWTLCRLSVLTPWLAYLHFLVISLLDNPQWFSPPCLYAFVWASQQWIMAGLCGQCSRVEVNILLLIPNHERHFNFHLRALGQSSSMPLGESSSPLWRFMWRGTEASWQHPMSPCQPWVTLVGGWAPIPVKPSDGCSPNLHLTTTS